MIAETLNSFTMITAYIHRLLADIPDDQMATQPAGLVNHPAWLLGHLTYSMQAVGGEIGLPPWLPPDWPKQYGTGSTPVANHEAYPSKAALLAAFDEAHHRLTDALSVLPATAMTALLPDERFRDRFPTIGHAVLHILCAHAALHAGQLTAWRRTMGLAPSAEPFA